MSILTGIIHPSFVLSAFSSQRPGIQPKLEALRALYEGKKIIVGRDKLDVVKGIVQKLRAFEKLLSDYPQWRGKVNSSPRLSSFRGRC